MKKLHKQVLSLATLSALLLTSFTGCSKDAATTGEPTGDGKENVTLSLMIPSHPSYPQEDDWEVIQYVKEATGVTLDIESVLNSGSSFDERLNITMVGDGLPDLIFPINNNCVKKYGDVGAFVNLFDHMEQLPHFSKWYESNKEAVTPYLSADGSLYQFPSVGLQESNRRGWLYREDIFAKHNLEVPTDSESLYTVLKELKTLYPDSYPLAFRSELAQLLMIAPSWNTDYFAANRHMYLDENDEFQFGPIDDEFKDMLMFFNKLYEEELLIPNFLTLDTAGWQEIMSTEQSFITIDYLSRIDFFNGPMRESNPDFNLKYMPPPKGGDNGVAMFPDSSVGLYGHIITSKTKNLDAALAYCDWYFSDEAVELISWGKEGETFEVVDGTKEWIDFADQTELRIDTGLSCYGFYQVYDFDATIALFSEETQYAYQEAEKYDLKTQPILAFNKEEQKVVNTTLTSITTYVAENISKMLIGELEFSEWDNYVKTVEEMGLDQVRTIYSDSYARLTK